MSSTVCLALADTYVGVDYFMVVYKTTDGGNTWLKLGGTTLMGGTAMFHLATADGQTVRSCGAICDPYPEPTVAFQSTDGGGKWNYQKVFHRTVMFGIDTRDGETWWMVGYQGWIMRSTCPSVFSISPERGRDADQLRTVSMAGSGFWDGMRVWLEKDGTLVEAENVNVASPYRALCAFNLNGFEDGAYDVVTMNVNGLQSRLKEGFDVTCPKVRQPPHR